LALLLLQGLALPLRPLVFPAPAAGKRNTKGWRRGIQKEKSGAMLYKQKR
jgi:hypothetical protein